MILHAPEVVKGAKHKPGLGLTMFGVTTAAVQSIAASLEESYETYVFHATGVGGRSMEKLVDEGFISAVVDITTTEVCDMLVGGVFPSTEDRFGAIIRTQIPYTGSVGAVDMVNFGSPSSVPEKFSERLFYNHNPQVTLMRTTVDECVEIGKWIVSRLNMMDGPVRFLLPELGLSALDAVDMPFHDPLANDALFSTIQSEFIETENRKLIRIQHHINDPEFAKLVVKNLYEICQIGAERGTN
jgi:uncharacterized protein (UPF0261 family)